MAASEAVEFIINDHGDVGKGFRDDFANDKPYKSLLQRQNKSFNEALDIFKWDGDDAKFTAEYDKKTPEFDKLVRYRRCVSFCVGGWREINEDFGRGDVSCLRDIRTPLVTSRTPLKSAKDDFDAND